MTYQVVFSKKALRQLKKLDQAIQKSAIEAIEALAKNPRPSGCKKLKGAANLYRIRVANTYRVVYSIQDSQLIVTVIKIGHSKNIYRS